MSILETVEEARAKSNQMISEEEFSRIVLHNDIPINLPYEVYRAQSILKDALMLISELEEEVSDLTLRIEALEYGPTDAIDFLRGFNARKDNS